MTKEKKTTKQKIIFDILIANIFVIIFGFIFGKNVFYTATIYFSLIGFVWFFGSILSLPTQSFSYTCLAAMLSVGILVICMISMCIFPSQGNTASYYASFTPQEVMGETPSAEWQITIYYNEYGLESSEQYSYCGNYEKAKWAMGVYVEEWNKNHPDKQAVKSELILTYLPKEYAKAHHYPEEYTKRY